MVPEEIAAKLHTIEVDLIALKTELIYVANGTRHIVDFINTMQQVVTEMSANPMFKAMGLSSVIISKDEVDRLPGM